MGSRYRGRPYHGLGEVKEEAERVDQTTGAVVSVGGEGDDNRLAAQWGGRDPLVGLVAVHHLMKRKDKGQRFLYELRSGESWDLLASRGP